MRESERTKSSLLAWSWLSGGLASAVGGSSTQDFYSRASRQWALATHGLDAKTLRTDVTAVGGQTGWGLLLSSPFLKSNTQTLGVS